MKKKNQQNVLPQEFKKYQVLKENELQKVVGGDVRSNNYRFWWENLFFNKR